MNQVIPEEVTRHQPDGPPKLKGWLVFFYTYQPIEGWKFYKVATEIKEVDETLEYLRNRGFHTTTIQLVA